MPECDVLVIGSGHNGLGLAAYCARAGLDVVVIESAGKIGGLLSTEDLGLTPWWSRDFTPGTPLVLPP